MSEIEQIIRDLWCMEIRDKTCEDDKKRLHMYKSHFINTKEYQFPLDVLPRLTRRELFDYSSTRDNGNPDDIIARGLLEAYTTENIQDYVLTVQDMFGHIDTVDFWRDAFDRHIFKGIRKRSNNLHHFYTVLVLNPITLLAGLSATTEMRKIAESINLISAIQCFMTGFDPEHVMALYSAYPDEFIEAINSDTEDGGDLNIILSMIIEGHTITRTITTSTLRQPCMITDEDVDMLEQNYGDTQHFISRSAFTDMMPCIPNADVRNRLYQHIY